MRDLIYRGVLILVGIILIFTSLVLANAQQQTYQPGDTYSKTFYVASNETIHQTNLLQVYPTQAVSFKRTVLYYNFRKLSGDLAFGQVIPITVTYKIPHNADSGSYLAMGIISILDFKNNKPHNAGSKSEIFYVETPQQTTPITTTVQTHICGNNLCELPYENQQTCSQDCKKSQPNYLLFGSLIIFMIISIIIILKKYKKI